MATRRTKPETEQLAQDVAQLLALDEESIDATTLNPALETLYAELGMTGDGEASVHVSKLDADGRGAEASVWRGDPDQYDLEMIAKKFGSGAYRVKVYVRILTGQKVCKGNKVFNWLLSSEDEAKRVAAQNPVTAAPVDMRAEIARIVADTMKAVMPPPVATAPDPMQMMAGLADIMSKLQPHTAPVAAPAPDPFAMMRGVVEMMTLMKDGQEPLERGANANGNDLLLAVINKFAPLLQSVVTAPGATDAPQLTAPQQPAQTVQPAPENDMNLRLKMGLNWLIGQCEGGGAPETYAEVIIDSVPEEALQQFLAAPSPIDELARFEQKVLNHREWFNELLNTCREMLTPETDEPVPAQTGIDKAQ